MVTLLAFVAVALAALQLQPVAAQRCSASQKLELRIANQWNTTLYSGDSLYDASATCSDGTPGGFYVDEVEERPVDADFIIWLGDAPICSGTDCDDLCSGTREGEANQGTICEGVSDTSLFSDLQGSAGTSDEDLIRCLYSRVTCTSDWWDLLSEVTPQTLLCHQDSFFGNFRRVFVPSCSNDWFLGGGNDNPASSNDPRRADRFQGSALLRNVLTELAYNYNLTSASRIVLGGTRGGAIGLLNQLNFIQTELPLLAARVNGTDSNPGRVVTAVLDSSWLFSAEKFTPRSDAPSEVFALENTLFNSSADWIASAAIDAACAARWPNPSQRFRCLFTEELVQSLPSSKLLFIQSQFDLLQLEGLGLLDESARDLYFDETSYAGAAISYIESYGAGVRDAVERAAALNGGTDEHHFFLAPCGQYMYVQPTALHSIDPQTARISDFGAVRFQFDFEVWEGTSLDGFSVRDAVVRFVSTDGASAVDGPNDAALGVSTPNNVRADGCGTFLCNPTCKTEIRPFVVEEAFGLCVRYMIIGYGASVLLIFYVMFLLSYAQVRRFRRAVGGYWARIQLVTAGDKDQGLREVQQQLLNEAASAEYRKIHLMVKNLSYWAPPRSRRSKPVQILNNIDLAFAPGNIHGIMGASGGGKSTLLDLLALARDSGQIAGTHFINGVASDSANCKFLRQWLRHNSSYVRQTDVLFPQLTVREHLVHAAWLMLPQYMPAEAKLRRVWQVMQLLELEGCADTICGDGGVAVEGGISGGQRRRVSVATQLLKLPAVLLLDEPTSGLDSTNALLLVKSLHVMAHEAGVNVVLTIHQPRREVLEYLDTLTFLAAGRVLFSGYATEAAEHFNIPPETTNYANDIIDVLQGTQPAQLVEFERAYVNGQLGQAVQEEIEAEISDLTAQQLASLQEILVENSISEGRWSWSESSSAATLSWVHLSRSMRRGGFELRTTGVLSFVGGLIVGIVFFGTDTYTSRTALAYLTVATMTFIQGTFLGDRYLGEKAMYDHEADAGTFRSWIAFLLSQYMRDCVSASVEGIAFAAPVYWLGGMNPDPERFGIYLLLLTLTSFVVLCQNVLIEIDRDDVRIAAMLQIGLLGLGALFSGFVVRLDDIPVYLSWVPYIMVTYWSFAATLINDLSDFSLPCDISTLECAARTGDVVIRSLSYDDRDVYTCIMVLLIFILVFRALGVVDFWARYVRKRGDKLKRVAADTSDTTDAGSRFPGGISRQESAGLSSTPGSDASAVGKSTMDTMLSAQTPTMKRQDSKPIKAQPGIASAAAVPTFRAMTREEMKAKKAEKRRKKDLPEVEMEFYQEENMRLSFVQGRVASVLLDRNIFVLWFLLDFYLTAYVCGFDDGETASSRISRQVETTDESGRAGLLALTAVICMVYTGFYFFQLFWLVPTTLDGRLDCTWSGVYDSVSALLLVLDIGLTFQSTSANSEFIILIVLALIVRAIRFVRVLIYWNKVDEYHRVRAQSFLDAKQELIEEIAATGHASLHQNPPAAPPVPGREARPPKPSPRPPKPGEKVAASTAPERPSRRISGFDLDAAASTKPVHRSLRPPRPTAGNRVSAAVRMAQPATGSRGHSSNLHGSSSKARPERPARPDRPARPGRPGRPAAVSQRFAGRPAGTDRAAADAIAAAPGSQWRPTGNGFYYNAATGQMLSMQQLAARRAPPPAPPGGIEFP